MTVVSGAMASPAGVRFIGVAGKPLPAYDGRASQ